MFLSHVTEARLRTSPKALDSLVRALYTNDATGRQLRTILFGTAAKAPSVENICRHVLFNPQKVSLFNQRKKELGLTRRRREPEAETIWKAPASKPAEEVGPEEQPRVAGEAEPVFSAIEEFDKLANYWHGLHISFGDVPAPELDIVELRSLMEQAQVAEEQMIEGLKDTWLARYENSDKTNPGQLFAGLRSELINRLRQHAGAKQHDAYPN